MAALNCEKCGQAMALADELCHACGAPAPKGAQAAVFLARAESAAGDRDWTEAVRQMDKALPGLEGVPLAAGLRKLGQWQEKRAAQGLAGAEDAAEAAFRRAREASEGDDLAHQLWIDHLVRRGLDARAQKLYEERLASDPEDSPSKRHLQALKLARDFKASPPKVKLDLGQGGGGMLAKMFAPSPLKLAMLGANTLVSALGWLAALVWGGKAMEAGAAGLQFETEVGTKMPDLGLMGMLTDPWSWGVSTLISGALWWWMWRSRR